MAVQPKLDFNQVVNGLPIGRFFGLRRMLTEQQGTHRNLLIRVWGGIGDEICAEPTLRFALETMKDMEISLCARTPSLFTHLKFKQVFRFLDKPEPDYRKFFWVDTMGKPDDSSWDFLCHPYLNCVDAPTLYAFRATLPIESKQVKLVNTQDEKNKIEKILEDDIQGDPFVVVHAGKHWKGKTFPKKWWDRVLQILKDEEIIPVLVGGHVPPFNSSEMPRSTVDVETDGCLDYRCKLTLMESAALIKRSKVVLSNDSAIIHMAADSDAWIIYITLTKHPDLLTHYRKGGWGWRMKNMGRGGIWNQTHFLTGVDIQQISYKDLYAWLPTPESFVGEAIEKLRMRGKQHSL